MRTLERRGDASIIRKQQNCAFPVSVCRVGGGTPTTTQQHTQRTPPSLASLRWRSCDCPTSETLHLLLQTSVWLSPLAPPSHCQFVFEIRSLSTNQFKSDSLWLNYHLRWLKKRRLLSTCLVGVLAAFQLRSERRCSSCDNGRVWLTLDNHSEWLNAEIRW